MGKTKLEKKQRKAYEQEKHRWYFHAAQNSLEESHISIIKEIGDSKKLITPLPITTPKVLHKRTEDKLNSLYYDAFGEESPFSLLDEKFIEIRTLSDGLPDDLSYFIVLGKLHEYHVDFGKEYCWTLSTKKFKWCPINIDYVKANTNKTSGSGCWGIVELYIKLRRLHPGLT